MNGTKASQLVNEDRSEAVVVYMIYILLIVSNIIIIFVSSIYDCWFFVAARVHEADGFS